MGRIGAFIIITCAILFYIGKLSLLGSAVLGPGDGQVSRAGGGGGGGAARASFNWESSFQLDNGSTANDFNISSLVPFSPLPVTPAPFFLPQIVLTPENLSFAESYWQSDHGKRVTITIYNPEYCLIKKGLIKFEVPSGWEFVPDVAHPFIYYIEEENAFLLQNFGNLKENFTNDWIEIKPGPSVAPRDYSMKAIARFEFEYHPPGLIYTPRLYSTNISKSVNLLVVKEHVSWLSGTNIAILSLFVGVLGFLFGPGIARGLVSRIWR